ncbi:MAG TPA: hypothetical protein VES19_01775 [Candidatus Limnocylindrales bacterium]|nr:hypothetical protein [Candidatus Limnocylindrales bacterium]
MTDERRDDELPPPLADYVAAEIRAAERDFRPRVRPQRRSSHAPLVGAVVAVVGVLVVAVVLLPRLAPTPAVQPTLPAATGSLPTPPPTSPATASPSAEPQPSPTVAAIPTTTWEQATIDGDALAGDVARIYVLPGAALAVEESRGETVTTRLLRSTDGLTWTRVPPPEKGFVLEIGTVLDDELTVIGHTGSSKSPKRAIWTTTDGLAWSQIEQAAPMRFGVGGFQSLSRASAGWLAEGFEIVDPENLAFHTYVSVDRSTWEKVTLPWVYGIPIASNGSTWAAFSGRAAGQDTARTSADGRTWASHPFPALETYDGVTAIAGTSAGFAAVGQHFVVETEASQPLGWTSADGTAWTPGTFRVIEGPAGEAAPRRIEVSAEGLVAYGNGDGPDMVAWVSADGAAWTQLAPLPVGSVSAVALWDDRVLVAGSAGENPPGLWVAVGRS